MQVSGVSFQTNNQRLAFKQSYLKMPVKTFLNPKNEIKNSAFAIRTFLGETVLSVSDAVKDKFKTKTLNNIINSFNIPEDMVNNVKSIKNVSKDITYIETEKPISKLEDLFKIQLA